MSPRRFHRPGLAALAAGLCALVTLGGCGSPPGLAPPEPPAVAVIQPKLRGYAPVREFTGRLATKDPVKVVPQVTGMIIARNFKDGTLVEKGKTLLYEIDPTLFLADQKKADADIKAAEAAMKKADADEKNWAAQKQRDDAELTRVEQQLAKGIGVPADKDKAVANIAVDVSNGLVAKANRDAAQANKEAAQAARAKADENLSYCKIYAPTSGKVGESQVAVHSVVTAYQTVMTQVDPVDNLYLYFEVDELTSLWYREQIARGALNDPSNPATPIRCWITLKDGRTYPQPPQPGQPLDYVAPEITRGTGTRTIRATFPNPEVPTKSGDSKTPRLRELSSGDSVRVRVEAGRPVQVLSVPETVVMSSARGKFVYVLNAQDEAEGRRVEIGPTFDATEPGPDGKPVKTRFQIIESGLTPTDRVVADNLLRVRPGVKVKVQ